MNNTDAINDAYEAAAQELVYNANVPSYKYYADPIVNRLEHLRKKVGLSIGNMSSFIGVSRVTYHNWLRDRGVRRAKREQIGDALVKIDDFFSRSDNALSDILKLKQAERVATLEEIVANHDPAALPPKVPVFLEAMPILTSTIMNVTLP